MQEEPTNFWTEIKTYEERLAQDPDTFLFARLAEVYLKVGLLDDALHTARQGVLKHPAYVAGQRALALACHAKGLLQECVQALLVVAAATPDDGEVQRMLGRLLASSGDAEGARKAFRTALDFHPEDLESRVEFEALTKPAAVSTAAEPSWQAEENGAEDEEILEELEILEVDEADLVEEDELDEEPADEPLAGAESHDPLPTATLAELYVQQGFLDKALDIYRTILETDPLNARVTARMAELEAAGEEPVAAVPAVETRDFVLPEDQQRADFSPEMGMPAQEQDAPHIAAASFSERSESLSDVPVKGVADSALATLEGWLDSIRRIKACR